MTYHKGSTGTITNADGDELVYCHTCRQYKLASKVKRTSKGHGKCDSCRNKSGGFKFGSRAK